MNRQAVTNRAVVVKNYREKGETSWKTCRQNLCSTNENAATIKFVPPSDTGDEDRQPENVRKRKETRERKNRRLVNGKILKFQRGQSIQYI